MPKLDPALLAQAREVDLIAYLHAHGHQAAYARANRALFHSPLRDDRTPSFSVRYHDKAWKWTDFGTDEHGDGIDLVMRLQGIDFQAAVKALLGHWTESSSQTIDAPRRRYSVREIRRLYQHLRSEMTPERTFLIHQYFLQRQIAFPEGLGLVYLDLAVHHDGTRIPYVGIPVPSPLTHLMTALECRALHDENLPKQYKKRTLGDKTLWVIRRPTNSILVTESILDCLAGNQLLQNRTSLCALNTINNIDLLTPCMTQLRPGTIYLALDNDPARHPSQTTATHAPPGPAAQRKATDRLLRAGFRVVEVRHHLDAKVKDLYRLLTHTATPITLEQIEQRGIVHEPTAP